MYVIFEGIDGGGKSTIINRVYQRMVQDHAVPLPVIYRFPCPLDAHQPGGEFGQRIRHAMAKTKPVTDQTLMYLFMAEAVEFDAWVKEHRSQHALLLDRHTITTGPVYQQDHHAIDDVQAVYRSHQFQIPDLVLLFDIDYQTHITRRRARNTQHEDLIFERDDEARFARMRSDYRAYFEGSNLHIPASKFAMINATLPMDVVEKQVWDQIGRFL